MKLKRFHNFISRNNTFTITLVHKVSYFTRANSYHLTESFSAFVNNQNNKL